MPKVTKIHMTESGYLAEDVNPKRGRPKGSKNKKSALDSKMYTFRCEKGCEVQFISKNAEGQCSTHRLWLELVK